MYLSHFGLHDNPFGLTPNTQYFCALPVHQEALNVLLIALHGGEGFIKITGEVGTGKTMLCRKLLNELGEGFATAYIPNPALTRAELLSAIAGELGIGNRHDLSQGELLEAINHRLLSIAADGKRLVLVLDEAQAIPPDSLELLRLLTNLETESRKLLQIVLFGQPELDVLLSEPHFRQLRQRITFSHKLAPLSLEDTRRYLFNRLRVAGYCERDLFTERAYRQLHRASRGIPRLINILSHKAMLAAYGQGAPVLEGNHIRAAAADTEGVDASGCAPKHHWSWRTPFAAGLGLALLSFGRLLQ